MKGAVKRQQTTTRNRQMPNRDQLLDELFPPAIVTPPSPTAASPATEVTRESPKRNHQQLDRQDTQPQELISCLKPDTEVKQETPPQEQVEETPYPPMKINRPRRNVKKPDRYGYNICEKIYGEPGHLQPGISQASQGSELAQTDNSSTRDLSGVATNLKRTTQAPRCQDIRYYSQRDDSHRSDGQRNDTRCQVVAPVRPTHLTRNTRGSEPLSPCVRVLDTAVNDPGVETNLGKLVN